MADIGVTIADGSFEQGATGVTQDIGVYQESIGKVFQWQLTNSFNITAGTLPSYYGADRIDKSNSMFVTYKVSSGSSAVDNTLAGIPVEPKLGVIISTGGTF